MCGACLSIKHQESIKSTKNLNLTYYNPSKHTLSEKWLNRFKKKYNKMVKINENQQMIVNNHQNIVNDLQRQIIPSSKYRRIKVINPDDHDYEAELKNIPNKSSTTRWQNRIVIDLMAEADCLNCTGWNRRSIIAQAQISKCNSEMVFHVRHMMYKYKTREDQARAFGWTAANLTKKIDETLEQMNERYAKSVLVNDRPMNQQYWNSDKIKERTPKFVYMLRQLDPKDPNSPIFLTADGTYQYTQQIETDQDIRKKQLNMHKHTSLIKIHIWAITNGQPICLEVTFGDGYNGDGKAFAAALNKRYVMGCMTAAENDTLDETHSFRNVSLCKKLLNLQEIVKIGRCRVIVDNGYKLANGHPMLKMPNEAPLSNDQDGQVTPLAAAHKRAIMAIRNGHERMNGWIKRYAFCRSVTRVADIHRIQAVWNIAAADMIHFNVILTKDDENSMRLTKRILDMMHVATNPADWWWSEDKLKNKKKKGKSSSSKNKKNVSLPRGKPTKDWKMSQIQKYVRIHQLGNSIKLAGQGRTKEVICAEINDMEISEADDDEDDDQNMETTIITNEDEDEDEDDQNMPQQLSQNMTQ